MQVVEETLIAERLSALIEHSSRAVSTGHGTGLFERNPTIGLKKRNAGRAKTRVLGPGEIRAFWQAIEPSTAFRLRFVTRIAQL
jgi:hypothetical protein